MTFTFDFVRLFVIGLLYAAPLLIALVVIIALIGQMIGKWEQWPRSDAIYFAFITATTVGYGDIRPKKGVSRFWAIIIALLGVVMTGLIVAMALQAASTAFVETRPHVVEQLQPK